MAKKWLSRLIFLVLTLLVSCAKAPEDNLFSTLPVIAEEGQPASSTESDLEEASPTIEIDWDDRTIFTQTLNTTGQQYLNILPEASIYHITLHIPEEMTEALQGEAKVRYFNLESNPLEEIYFRLFPNFYGGLLTVTNVEVDGLPVEIKLESSDTALRVDLAQPLAPGESVVITMNYELILPESMSGNYGLLGYFDDILVLDTFYPMIPAYDEDGWYAHYPYPNGDLTYTDASFYLVEVTAPADLVLASSGAVVERSVQDGVQRLAIASGPAREFYLAWIKYFEVMTDQFDGITVNSYALEGYAAIQELALRFSGQALQIFSDLYGEYPYQEFDVISSPMLALGIEYPGITGIFLGLYDENGSTYGLSNQIMIESVIAHEVGHQWFYNIVGNDQQSEPWVDEALVQYLTYQYFEKEYGKGAGSGIIQSWNDRWARVDFEEMPIGLIASDYGDSAYSPIVYGRGPLFFLELEEKLGEELLLNGINIYTQQYLWEEGNTEVLRASLEAGCGCDLGELFETWIYPFE